MSSARPIATTAFATAVRSSTDSAAYSKPTMSMPGEKMSITSAPPSIAISAVLTP